MLLPLPVAAVSASTVTASGPLRWRLSPGGAPAWVKADLMRSTTFCAELLLFAAAGLTETTA